MKPLSLVRSLAVIVALLLSLCLHAQNDSTRYFTKEHPLIYEDAYDLWPYSFLNEYEEPEGYNIDLIRILLKKLNIPYVIHLKHRPEVIADLKAGQIDLTMGMADSSHVSYCRFGKSVTQLFTHSVVTPESMPVSIKALADLGRQKVIVHDNSYSHDLMKRQGWADNAIPYDNMWDAVMRVSNEQRGQIVWNTASLKWLIYSNKLDDVRLTAVDMPHGEYKFMSANQHLLDQLDSVYALVRSTNQLESIRTKWFYPERRETGLPSWIWYVTGIIALIAGILIYYNVTYRTRERKARELARQRNSRLALILQACRVRVWTYDVKTQTFTWLDRNGKPQRSYTSLEFARLYHPEDFRHLGEGIRKLVSGSTDKVTLELKAKDDESNTDKMREYVIMLSVLRHEQGHPSIIMGTKSDVTDEHENQEKAKVRMLRYQSMFNNVMVDMVYYDENGNVTEMNERARHTFRMNADEGKSKGTMVANPIKGLSFDFSNPDYFYATTFLDASGNYEGVTSIKKPGTIFYEWQIVPVMTPDKKMLGAYGTGRDVTEAVEAYRKVQQGIVQLQKANKEMTDYVANINYVLGMGGVRMATYEPDTHTLKIYKELGIVQQSLTQARCMTLVDDKSKKKAMRMLNNMDNLTTNVVDIEIVTSIRLKGHPLYLQFRFMPLKDEAGRVYSYFGMCRDLSEIKGIETLLVKESARAQEIENLKNSFLRNMSYEIRTPLNAVVGFAELFEQEHSPEDEVVFVQEIKENSAHLLHLINDILFLSRLDANMIEVNRQPIDFAKTFEGHCQIGWANDQQEGVKYLTENPYERLIVDIDDNNLGRIIEQVVANAAQHTKSGSVRARYDYMGGKLMIMVDDTGCGMSKSTLDTVYERFSSGDHHGTGLGIPICQELAKLMGGSMDISSEESKGTTVWVAIPCTATAIERK